MPCYTPPAPSVSVETYESLFNEKEYYKNQSNITTEMLCRICSNENYGVIEMRLPDDILKWWEEHKKFDESRKDK